MQDLWSLVEDTVPLDVALVAELILFALVAFYVISQAYSEKSRISKKQNKNKGTKDESGDSKNVGEKYKAMVAKLVEDSLSSNGKLLTLMSTTASDNIPLSCLLDASDVAELFVSLEHLRCSAPRTVSDARILERFSRLHTLELYSHIPLQLDVLKIIFNLPGLDTLDLTKCRVLDTNNAIKDMASPMDIFELHCEREKSLKNLVVPDMCAVRIGSIDHVFPKVKVVVVALDKPLSLQDRVEFRRRAPEAVEIYRSKSTVVNSIRTDDHRQLTRAIPDAKEYKFAIPVMEPGRKGDDVYWLGQSL
eukprot:m.11628 g.11628  ORF g.11628 m.11628 type:complete len:305 (+) comp4493_c0_seq1:199-1113(+)